MKRCVRVMGWSVACAAWAAAACAGFARLWSYEGAPGIAAAAPLALPAASHVARIGGLPTLIVALHPKCPCSRATVEELARLMTACQGRVTATVLMVRPSEMPQGWEKTDLWQSAAAIPGVTVVTDIDGVEAHRYGAETSGQALLYSADGRLLFAGGITESRGHMGDNAGRSTAVSLVNGTTLPSRSNARPAQTPVFGCPLFDGNDVTQENTTCPK